MITPFKAQNWFPRTIYNSFACHSTMMSGDSLLNWVKIVRGTGNQSAYPNYYLRAMFDFEVNSTPNRSDYGRTLSIAKISLNSVSPFGAVDNQENQEKRSNHYTRL